MPSAYIKQTWANGVGGATPITAARLSYIEDGIENATVADGTYPETATVLLKAGNLAGVANTDTALANIGAAKLVNTDANTGRTIYVGTAAPAAPVVGDLWFDGSITDTPLSLAALDLRFAPKGTSAIARPFRFGNWHAFPRGPATTTATTDQRMNLIPFDVERACTLVAIGIEVVTTPGSTGSVVRLGVFSDEVVSSLATNWPGELLLDAGTVVTTSTGAKSIVVSQALPIGRHWAAVCGQGAPSTAPVLRAIGPSNDPTIGMVNQTDVQGMGLFRSSVSAGLPSPAAPTATTTLVPMVTLKFAA